MKKINKYKLYKSNLEKKWENMLSTYVKVQQRDDLLIEALTRLDIYLNNAKLDIIARKIK